MYIFVYTYTQKKPSIKPFINVYILAHYFGSFRNGDVFIFMYCGIEPIATTVMVHYIDDILTKSDCFRANCCAVCMCVPDCYCCSIDNC